MDRHNTSVSQAVGHQGAVPIVNQFITKSCRSEASIIAPTVCHLPAWLSLHIHKLLDPAFLAQLKIECKANCSYPEIRYQLSGWRRFFMLVGGGIPITSLYPVQNMEIKNNRNILPACRHLDTQNVNISAWKIGVMVSHRSLLAGRLTLGELRLWPGAMAGAMMGERQQDSINSLGVKIPFDNNPTWRTGNRTQLSAGQYQLAIGNYHELIIQW